MRGAVKAIARGCIRAVAVPCGRCVYVYHVESPRDIGGQAVALSGPYRILRKALKTIRKNRRYAKNGTSDYSFIQFSFYRRERTSVRNGFAGIPNF